VTTDKFCGLNCWNLEKEKIEWQLCNKEHIKNLIVDLKEIVHLKLTAVASLDKKVTIWNLLE
jgi:hypothetical protein